MARTPALLRALTGEDEDEITELEKFEPERVDAVGTPANGFPVLLMKGIATTDSAAQGGDMDETTQPPMDGGDDPVVKDDGDRDGDGENALPSDKDTGPDDGDGDEAAEKAASADAGDAEAAEDGAEDVEKAPALDPEPVDVVAKASPADREAAT